MKPSRQRAAVVACLCCVLAFPVVAACDDNAAQSEQSGMASFTVKTVSGREIECVKWSGYRKGGLSCDWGAK